jgi:hypothetical protein
MDLPAHGAPSNRTTEARRIVAATEDGFRHNLMSAPNVVVGSRRADEERHLSTGPGSQGARRLVDRPRTPIPMDRSRS